MEKSETINELASALAKAQGEMKPALMNRINPFFKNKYADLQSVWDAIRSCFSKNGLSITQTVHTDEKGSYLLTGLLHSSGQWILSSIKLNPVKQDPQGLGSAISYARRYALSAIAGVCSDEDDDANAASGKAKIPNEKNEKHDPAMAYFDELPFEEFEENDSKKETQDQGFTGGPPFLKGKMFSDKIKEPSFLRYAKSEIEHNYAKAHPDIKEFYKYAKERGAIK